MSLDSPKVSTCPNSLWNRPLYSFTCTPSRRTKTLWLRNLLKDTSVNNGASNPHSARLSKTQTLKSSALHHSAIINNINNFENRPKKMAKENTHKQKNCKFGFCDITKIKRRHRSDSFQLQPSCNREELGRSRKRNKNKPHWWRCRTDTKHWLNCTVFFSLFKYHHKPQGKLTG